MDRNESVGRARQGDLPDRLARLGVSVCLSGLIKSEVPVIKERFESTLRYVACGFSESHSMPHTVGSCQ